MMIRILTVLLSVVKISESAVGDVCNTCVQMMLCPETKCADNSCSGCCGECRIPLNEKGAEQCTEIVSTCTETVPVCPDSMEWNECGSACPLQCGQSKLTDCAAVCVPSCECVTATPYLLADASGCVAENECPATTTTCPQTMAFTNCGTACPKTCGVAESTMCTMNCVAECQCEDAALYYSDVAGICVEKAKCPTDETAASTTSGPSTTAGTEGSGNDCGPLSVEIVFEVISEAVQNKIETFCKFCRRKQITMDECVEVSEFVEGKFEDKFDVSLKDCLLDNCEMDECAVGVKLRDNWLEEECGCDMFECDYVLGSEAHQFGIMIEIGLIVMVMLSSM